MSVFIGNKALMNYVLAIVAQIATANEVVIKARGRAISKAVDVVEVARSRFLPDTIYKDIKLGTETIKREDGSEFKVSSIEIVLVKQ